jgi:hypothetical protein
LLDDADALVAGRPEAQGVLLFREDAVVHAQVAAADGEVLHADEDLALLEGGHGGVFELKPPGTDQLRRLHRSSKKS